MSLADETETAAVRVVLPFHLRNLASVSDEVTLEVATPVTTNTILDALERRYPMLQGTVREHVTKQRRPKVRFFANGADITHQPPDQPLADAVANGEVPFMIIGAIAGG